MRLELHKTVVFGLYVFGCTQLSGCSSLKQGTTESSLNKVAIGPTGRYETPCKVDGDTSQQEAWVFAADVSRFFHQTSTFSDKVCGSSTMTSAPAGTYKIALNASNDYDIDFHIVQPPGLPDEFSTLRLLGNQLYMAEKTSTSNGTSRATRAKDINERVVFTHVDP